jgi:hypothetical protein
MGEALVFHRSVNLSVMFKVRFALFDKRISASLRCAADLMTEQNLAHATARAVSRERDDKN